MEWETAERLQKNSAGEFRALIGGVWVPVERAQKNSAGQFRVMRSSKSGNLRKENPAEYDPTSGAFQQKYGPGAQNALEKTGEFFVEQGFTPGNLARQAGLATRYVAGDTIADFAGLPSPNPGAEQTVANFAKPVGTALATAYGAAKLAPQVVSYAKPAMEWLAANPAAQLKAALGLGAGSTVADKIDAGPLARTGLELVGAVTVPAGMNVAGRGFNKIIAEPAKDIGATIGATFGNKKAMRRIETDFLERNLREQKGRVVGALQSATEYVPGVKPSSAEALAEANAKLPDEQIGGFVARLQRDLSGAKGAEDVLPSFIKGQEKALADAKSAAWAKAEPLKNAAIKALDDRGGAPAEPLILKLSELLTQEGTRTNKVARRSLLEIMGNVRRLSRNGAPLTGNDLWGIRKGIGEVIESQAKKNKIRWSKADTISASRQIQLAIDDVFEAAGGTGWKNYLKSYSGDMAKIDAHVARAEAAAEIAKGIKPVSSSQIAPRETPTLPALLNWKMTVANWGLKLVTRGAGDPVVRDLAERIKDPKQFAELLQRPASDPLRQLTIEAIKRGEMAAAQSAISANQETQ